MMEPGRVGSSGGESTKFARVVYHIPWVSNTEGRIRGAGVDECDHQVQSGFRVGRGVEKMGMSGVIVVDVSHCEVLESLNSEGSVSVVLHHGEPVVNVAAAGGSCVDNTDGELNDSAHGTPTPSTPLALPSFSSAPPPSSSGSNTLPHDNFTPQHCASGETTARQLTPEEYSRLVDYFAKHPDGKISEGIVPPAFRPFLPTRIQYALSEFYEFSFHVHYFPSTPAIVAMIGRWVIRLYALHI